MALEVGHKAFKREVKRARVEGRPTPTVAIVGGGLSGMATAIQLVRAGVRSFTVIEQSEGVGGTWRDNSYPGAACDVPSHLYSFSFAPKTDWSRRFAEQAEILSYAEDLVDRYHLAPHLRFGTTVQSAAYDEESGGWLLGIHHASGDAVVTADTVVFACGQLNRPHVPDIKGLESFAGPSWHSARWDHTVDLAGKRVAVVGTGASAIQFVPLVASAAAATTIFQRSPNYIGPKKDRPYRPGVRRALRRIGVLRSAYRWWIYWTLEVRWLWFRRDSLAGRQLQSLFRKGIRDEVVNDRLPDRVVVPDYPLGCKRVLISNDWYPALLRPDVTVVDSPVTRIAPDALVTADGTWHPTDILIYGTGFVTTSFLSHISVTGAGGLRLSDAWDGGAHAYLGTAVAGFPNFYVLYGPNTNLGHNSILFMVERQLNLVLQALAVQTRATTGSGRAAVAVRKAPYERDDRLTQRRMGRTAWSADCTSWYKNTAGRITNNWPTWTVRFWWNTLRIRSTDFEVAVPEDVTHPG
jgi:cation diffusion facilitator CzcD-associated flavoprotein CzcO